MAGQEKGLIKSPVLQAAWTERHRYDSIYALSIMKEQKLRKRFCKPPNAEELEVMDSRSGNALIMGERVGCSEGWRIFEATLASVSMN